MSTFADLSRPLALLRLLAADHPDLPAVDVHISRRSPDRLSLEIHGDLGAFEAWREALDIDPVTVRRNLFSGDLNMTLTASGEVAECRVQIVGYGPNLALLKKAA